MNKYPRVTFRKDNRPRGLCKLCHKPRAESFVVVECSIFRGDDFVYKVHADCWYQLTKEERLKRFTIA